MPPRSRKSASGQSSLTDSFRVTKRDDQPLLRNKLVEAKVSPPPAVIAIDDEEEKVSKPVTSISTEPKRPLLSVEDPKYELFLQQLQSREISEPVDREDDTVERILKLFDFMEEFGPVSGLSRLERWNRAASLGKSPPDIIREILETQQGVDESKYSQSYLYQYV